MANEFAIINNPTSTPEAVSTGYQRQNTNMVAARVGMDASVVSGGTGQCTLEISGPVDVNGVLYSCGTAVNLVPGSGAGRYFIYLSGSGNNLTPVLAQDDGTFDPDKNARYTSGGYKVLNWVIDYDGTDCVAFRWLHPERDGGVDIDEAIETWITASGTWTCPRSKWYKIFMTGGGGSGGSVTDNYRVAGGGGAGATGIKRIFIEKGDAWTATIGAGVATVFTDGSTSLNAAPGSGGTDNRGHAATGGQGGSTASGCDTVVAGGDGANGIAAYSTRDGSTYINTFFGGHGGSSFYGGGGRGGFRTGSYSNYDAKNGVAYGSGGGGAARDTAASAAGTGAPGVIRIIG